MSKELVLTYMINLQPVGSVEELSERDLLERHIKHAKSVRARYASYYTLFYLFILTFYVFVICCQFEVFILIIKFVNKTVEMEKLFRGKGLFGRACWCFIWMDFDVQLWSRERINGREIFNLHVIS